MFTGTYTALVTPFKNGKIDEAALERFHESGDRRFEGRYRSYRAGLELERGNPSVYADASQAEAGVIVFNPWCLREDDTEKIAARLKPLLRY